jgi:hypothetical protein
MSARPRKITVAEVRGVAVVRFLLLPTLLTAFFTRALDLPLFFDA